MKTKLDIDALCKEAGEFSKIQSKTEEPDLYGITDGKAVGTYLEHKFQNRLEEKYIYERGCSAKGIDFPELLVDIKVTSIKQPQSSCPYKTARQKIFGLGYSLLVFVYERIDKEKSRRSLLNILHNIFIESHRTADFQMTKGLRQILENEGNKDDIIAFLFDRNLPVEEVEANKIAEILLKNKPEQGYITISNALQWRLQFGRVIEQAGRREGITRII